MIQSDTDHDKSEQLQFIIEYEDTTRAWHDWKYGNVIQKPIVKEQFSISLVECTKFYMTHIDSFENIHQTISSEAIDIPSIVTKLPETDTHCHICQKSQSQLYPCRTCGKVYHQQCIKDIGEIRSFNIIKEATHKIGWSCPFCEDLRIVLPPEELIETHEWIKSLDNQTIFNLDNYINSRIKSKFFDSSYPEESYDDIKTVLELFLHTIIDITSNRLSHRDLLIIDVSMKILNTPPKFLVYGLTQFELYGLSQLFILLSSEDNQYIASTKFNECFNTYLSAIQPELDSNEKYSHLQALAYSFLGPTTKYDRTWREFILNATIPTLLGRYNHRKPLNLINRTISTKRPINPMTKNLPEPTDEQFLVKFMNTIVQKLQQIFENKTEPTTLEHPI